MRRLPLADQLPYRFYPPRISRPWLWAARFYIARLMHKQSRIAEYQIAGTEHLQLLIDRGDGVMLAPNHCDNADCGVVFELSRRVRKPFFYMAAYQIFTGIGRWGLPRIGVFPVDREGADLTAFKTGIEVLNKGQHPLVIFPEGEIYHMADRLTPLREGAGTLAATAAKKKDGGKKVWVVPAAIKYRFLEGHDPMPCLHELMDRLESAFTWRHGRDHPLADRIYRYAEGMLGLKELEYIGDAQAGPLKDRLVRLRSFVLDRLEQRRLGKVHSDQPVPVRVKEIRHACLEALADPKTTPAEAEQLRRDLEDCFGVVQLFSYPGDYIRESPTLERVAEIMTKLEEDFLGVDLSVPRAPRRAIIHVGEPIDVNQALASAGGKLRGAGVAITTEMEHRIQALLDAIGPGRPVAPPDAPAAAATGSAQPNVPSPGALQSSSA